MERMAGERLFGDTNLGMPTELVVAALRDLPPMFQTAALTAAHRQWNEVFKPMAESGNSMTRNQAIRNAAYFARKELWDVPNPLIPIPPGSP